MWNKRFIPILPFLLLSLCVKADGNVFCLFSDDVKSQYPSVIYDFLERYLYQMDSLNTAGVYTGQRLRDDKVTFHVGSPAVARIIRPDTPVSINRMESKYYQVVWSDTLGTPLLDISFPIQFELLLGKPKVEIETEVQTMLDTISVPDYKVDKSADSLVELGAGIFKSGLSRSYYLESLNDDTYYQKSDSGVLEPYFNADNKWYSVCNLLQGVIQASNDYKLYVSQSLYGFNSKTYMVGLWQWLTYCKRMHAVVYTTVEEEREDGLKVLLIARCEDLGFNHMMSLVVPWNFVDNPKSVIKAQLNAFIPTDNVKNLYQQYTDKPKKKI